MVNRPRTPSRSGRGSGAVHLCAGPPRPLVEVQRPDQERSDESPVITT